MAIRIGQFEQVNPKEVWHDGQAGFVAWLAEPENLQSFGDFLGITMEHIDDAAMKQRMSADLLCRETGEKGQEHIIAIQTRLGDSTDNELSNILSYINGFRRLTFVWVATPFADKHKKALDNLNAITKDGIDFFGIEFGMWRIGKSEPAVWLDVVSKPEAFEVANEVTSEATRAATPSTTPANTAPTPTPTPPTSIPPADTTPPPASTQQAQQAETASQAVPDSANPANPVSPAAGDFVASIGQATAAPQQETNVPLTQEYWQILRDRITQKSSVLSLPNPTPEEWTSYDIGCHNFYLIAVVHFSQPSSISVALVCQGPEARRNFGLLQKQREKIEWEVGVNLEWLDSPGRPFPHVVLVKNADPSNKDAWQNQHDWLVATLEKFDAAFRPRAKMIDSSSAQSG